ncbi:O-antigen polysaccharide polymerase Wzy [Microbacterium sp. VKM Ac-2870]|uniref:O-antigen polysaccharide polymerase Wzy n=1 Tax=Microbacterium sp. VKM Ac-2870 TaxID=2783825 RepID=UPI00188A2500|nr:O-antigen polysaccharide polymerase Wzy [Microbacterium sp. VKM Ac-2870]MBF4561456.1 O-antigen polysaccharide polymerase Wzy [Microbacterium sp. VKM Ac-2870]
MSRPVRISVELLLLVALTLWFASAPVGFSVLPGIICLLIAYIYLVLSFLRPMRVRGFHPSLFTVELLFQLFYFVIFFMPYQLALLGLQDLRVSSFVLNTFADESNRAVILAAVGIVAFNLGFGLVRHVPSQEDPSISATNWNTQGLQLIVLLAQAGLTVLYIGSGWRGAGEGRYTGSESGGAAADGTSLLITMFSMIGAVIALAPPPPGRFRRLNALGMASIGLGGWWALRTLVLGDRNTFLLWAITIAASLAIYHLRVGRVALVVGALAAFMLYNAIEYLRMHEGADFAELLGAVWNPGGASGAVDSSFNITTISVRAGIDAVPNHIDFGLGAYKLLGIAGIVPLVRGALFSPSSAFSTTGDILTYWMIGPTAGWSVGTNVVSDIYIDFGVVGVAIGMCAVGIFGAAISRWFSRAPTDLPRQVIYVLVVSCYAQLPRYALDFPIRILVWSGTLLVVWSIWSRAALRRKGVTVETRVRG